MDFEIDWSYPVARDYDLIGPYTDVDWILQTEVSNG